MATDYAAAMQYIQTLPPAERQAAMDRLMGREPQMQGSPEDIASVMGIGSVNDQLSDQEKAKAQAQALRDTGIPEGRTSRGGVYTAANPMEHIAALGRQAAGIYKESTAKDKEKELRTERDRLKSLMYGMQYGIPSSAGGGLGQNPMGYSDEDI